MRRMFPRVGIFLLATASLLCAQASIPGKFYEYYTVATTQGGTFTALGPPSINDNGLCAFTGQNAAGQTIWVSDGHLVGLRNINPGQANLGRNFFDPQLQINTNNQVVAKDFIPGTSQNIRIWDANLTDSFVYLARAGVGQFYTAVNGAPTLNAKGDGVFGAVDPNVISHELIEVSGGVTSAFGINSTAPEPVIAANGSMVVTTPNRGTGLNQIILFTNGFASQTIIASGADFSYLDTAPGISDDGNVVVFQGNLTPAGVTHLGLTGGAGPGIFAAANTGSAWQIIRVTGLQAEVIGSGGNNDGVCDPGETCANAAELGYDDNNNSINFSSYPTNSRVAVANVDFGAPGIADDTFVISFMGVPSHASRTNPVTKNTPLLFSASTGLWTIRVDVKNQLVGAKALVFHPYTAIPVVQVGDQLGTNNFVTGLSVNLQIANAAEDEFGTDRTMRRGDHRIAFEATMNGTTTQTIFRANHLDSSQDGILDHWKTMGIDMDQDGFVDMSLSAMGAVVGQRDLFVEMDWQSDQPGFNFHPAPGVISDWAGKAGFLPAMLATAPALAGNMYGVRRDGTTPATIPAGITMHIDGGPGLDFDGQPFSYNMGSGPLNGGDQIGMSGNNSALVEVLYYGVPGSINLPGVNTRAFQDVKDNFFGSQDKDARELAFKYAVLADHFEFIDSPPANHPISGAGPNFILVGDPYPAGGVRSGNFIKITAGTDAGETVRITGFDTVTLNKMYVTPFTTVPDTSSTFAYISGSTGKSEVFFYPSPDNNSLPGNDFILSLGDQAVNPDGYLMNACAQWRTLAHEMGHTMGLRHGGVDHQTHNANYQSLMSYSYQLVCNPPSPVQGYSTAGDFVFDDFANLNHQFAQVFFHSGNTLGKGYGSIAESTQQVPEQNFQDYINQNGPVDLVKPVIAITAPAGGSQVGSSLTVTIQATDNVGVTSVKASFDANGDGTLQPSEIVSAVPAGGNLYTATFNSVTGSLSPRTLTAVAFDASGNTGQTSISLNVGTVTQFALSVTLAGTGSGSVSSSPAGITCPTTCSANYNSGTPVTLTAAAGTGSTFAGWSGACSGTGTCSVTMSAAKSVTATFNTTPVQFALTVTEAGTGTGTVTSSPAGINCPTTCSANYNSGTPVTLTAAAGSGSTFAGWSGACSGTGTCAVTMSAAKSVTATFNTTPVQFALTVTEAGTGSGTVTSSPAGISCPSTCSANYNSGTPVTLTAVAGSGSTFAGWSGACSGTGTCAVIMSAAQSVTATFNTTPVQFALTVTEAGTGSGTVTSSPTGINCPSTCSANYNSGTPVTLTAVAGSGSTFAGWSGACSGTGTCAVTMSSAQSVTATFNTTPVQFALTVTEAGTGSGTVTSSPAGINCPSTCSANYNSGTPVTLTAVAGSGSTFAGWSGACSGTGTCSVTMSAAKSVTATFNTTPVQFALTVTEAGTGSGTVTSSPSGINCPSTCSANYNSGTPVTLTAVAGSGSTFAGWSGACSGTGSCSVTMSSAQAVTATFNTTPVQFALTVTEAGTGSGTLTSSPSGINCPSTCSANYNSGTPVTLTAVAGSGSTFAGWSGACSGTGTCSVTMSSAQSVTATFNTTPVQFALTVTEAGTGSGTVISSPSGISCPSTCSANYNSGTPVRLTAVAGTGATFAGWSGACSGTGTCAVTMSAAKSVTATFNTTPVQFALTVTEAGTGSGTVTSSPSGISCPSTCSANYNSGTPVTLTAAAGTGSTFAGWSGACSGTGTCSVTMSSAQSVTATFNTTPVQFALTVTEAGTGSGTVTSSPSGINCPSTCSANYNSGTPVTLTAVASSGSTFAGWSGACSGTGTCAVTMSAAKSVTATFNTTPVQFALTVTEAGTGSGTVTGSPSGINCPSTCSANYNSGTPVTLTATAGTGSTFAGWSGACSGTGSCSVTMSQARALTATFSGSGTESPAISATIVGRGWYSPTVLFVDLLLKNVGSGISVHTAINQIEPSTVAGTGTVTYNHALSPMVPIAAGNLAPGGTFKVRLYFNVPTTVSKLMLTEKGSMSSSTGTGFSYTQSQTLNH